MPAQKCMISVKQLIAITTPAHWRCEIRINRTSQISINEIYVKHELPINLTIFLNRLLDEPEFVRYGWLSKLIFPNQPTIPHDSYAAIKPQ